MPPMTHGRGTHPGTIPAIIPGMTPGTILGTMATTATTAHGAMAGTIPGTGIMVGAIAATTARGIIPGTMAVDGMAAAMPITVADTIATPLLAAPATVTATIMVRPIMDAAQPIAAVVR